MLVQREVMKGMMSEEGLRIMPLSSDFDTECMFAT